MLLPYGKVTVTTAGTPVRATSNLSVPADPVPVQSFFVQAAPANTGIVYIFQGGANFTGTDDRTTLRRCIGILPPPGDASAGPFPAASYAQPVIPAGMNLADIWFDTSVSGSAVIVSAVTG
jgi:hypothetical protein